MLYFTHRNGPIFRAKTDLSDLQFKSYLSQGALEPQSTFHLFTNQVYKPFYIRYEENKKNKQTNKPYKHQTNPALQGLTLELS